MYLYIEKTAIGYRVRRDIPGTASKEGRHYVGRTARQAEKQFRRNFDCIGKHFTRICF